jgi:hypothetical protein
MNSKATPEISQKKGIETSSRYSATKNISPCFPGRRPEADPLCNDH